MYHIIINPKSRSGKGLQIWTAVQKELDQRNVSYTFYFTKYKFHATQITSKLCENLLGVKTIIVLGGDGTINEVINGISDFDQVILGYIPTGSSNDLARSLKVPKDPIISLEHILSPTEFKYVDIGIIKMMESGTDRKFAVSTGLGFDAAICEEALRSNIKNVLNKFGLGKLTYVIIALKQLISCPFLEGDVIVDGKIIHSYKKILLITAMIHKFEGGGMRIAPAANPFDGKLSVCIAHDLSKLRVLSVLPFLLFGKHTHFKGIETFDCKTLEINLHKPTIVHVDGEYPGSFQHVEVSCAPKQLRIIL